MLVLSRGSPPTRPLAVLLTVVVFAGALINAWRAAPLASDPALPDAVPTPTPTAASTDCGVDPTRGLYAPNRGSDDLLRLTDKHTASLGDFEPPNLDTLERDYALGDGMRLRARPARQLRRMVTAAAAEGITLRLLSGYRSCPAQAVIFARFVATLGLHEAERISARPGHSEHQLGLAADITGPGVGWRLSKAFGDTPEGRWLAAHAPEYGFVLSYPAGNAEERITGYAYEPWHFRFIGQGHAARFMRKRAAAGITLNRWLLIEDFRHKRQRR